MKKLTNEEKLVLEIIRSDSEEDLKNNIENLVKRPIDWFQFAKSTGKASPAVYKKLKSIENKLEIPTEILDYYKKIYIYVKKKNEEMEKEILNLARIFKEEKIDLIFLKGAALINTVYRNDIGLRPMSDIDFLIDKKELDKASGLLEKHGYNLNEAYRSEDWYKDKHFHLRYFKSRITAELHWDIGCDIEYINPDGEAGFRPANKRCIADLIDSKRRVTINGDEMLVLSPENDIFLLLVHMNRSLETYWTLRFGRKIYYISNISHFFYELKEIIKSYKEIDWSKVIVAIKEAKIKFPLYSLLYLAEKYFKVGVPKKVLQQIKKNFIMQIYSIFSRKSEIDDLVEYFVNREILLRIFVGNIYHATLLYAYFYLTKPFFKIRRIVKKIYHLPS